MKLWDWMRGGVPVEVPPKTLEEAGDKLARAVIENLDWMAQYAPGGVPDWFDRHLEAVRFWWSLRA